MKQRSPVLGYNHNVRYAGRLWHVQTEDSGVQNPHIFTHLFHDGTILATKRLDYDAASEVSAVQKLMQAQHKGMLRELKAGQFDEKIGKFFGEPVSRVAEDETTDPNAQPPIATDIDLDDDRSPTPVELPNLPAPPLAQTQPSAAAPARPNPGTIAAPRPAAAPTAATPARPAAAAAPNRPAGPATQPAAARPATTPNAPRAPVGGVGGIGGRRPSSVQTGAHKPVEGVVVARPAVIIGGESQAPRAGTKPGTAPASSTRWHPPSTPVAQKPATAPGEQPKPPTNDNIFGGDLISEKSLDEVILAYLSEDLNEK
jgi:hypothetical protein